MTDDAKQQVVAYVEEHPGTSYVELERVLGDHIEVSGEMVLNSQVDPKINFWFNVSEEFVDIILDLLGDGEIHWRSTHPLTYHADGKVPNVDLVRQPPEDGYTTERWLPVAFYPGPAPDTEGDLSEQIN